MFIKDVALSEIILVLVSPTQRKKLILWSKVNAVYKILHFMTFIEAKISIIEFS